MDPLLRHNVAIVTGASRGIGRAIALGLAPSVIPSEARNLC